MNETLQTLQSERFLAIIGTAGRKDDAERLDRNAWGKMIEVTAPFVRSGGFSGLVSGGAAWADHLAVVFAPEMPEPSVIWIPENEEDRRIGRWYHKKFSDKIKENTLGQINAAWREGHLIVKRHGGFKERNSKVAESAGSFLAITFGDGARVKDGGTADTVRKMLREGKRGFHLDLNTFTIHPNAFA